MISRKNRLARTLAGLALGATALAGCTSGADTDADEASAAEQIGSSTAPSASPSPTVDVEDEAVTAAEQALRDYYETEDTAYHDPAAFDMSRFEDVAVGKALADVNGLVNTAVTEGMSTTGQTEVEIRGIENVSLESEPETDPPVHSIVDFKVCVDMSKVEVFVEGASQGDQQDTLLTYVRMANDEYPDGAWRVAEMNYAEGLKSC